MIKRKLDTKSLLMDYAIYVILTALVVIIAVISPKFLSINVAKDILMQSAVRIVVAMGCMFIIISGSADLSGGRMVGLAALIAASLAQSANASLKFWPNLPELPIFVPVLAAMLAGVCFGVFNGLVVSKLKVPAFLATLGTQMIIFGFSSLYFNMEPNSSQPLGSLLKGFRNLGGGSILGIPVIVIIALLVMLVVWILLTKTCLGKEIFAVGGNLEAARVFGINVFKI